MQPSPSLAHASPILLLASPSFLFAWLMRSRPNPVPPDCDAGGSANKLLIPDRICLWNAADSFRYLKDNANVKSAARMILKRSHDDLQRKLARLLPYSESDLDRMQLIDKAISEDRKAGVTALCFVPAFQTRQTLLASCSGKNWIRLWDFERDLVWVSHRLPCALPFASLLQTVLHCTARHGTARHGAEWRCVAHRTALHNSALICGAVLCTCGGKPFSTAPIRGVWCLTRICIISTSKTLIWTF
jgi:hypothetical protein